VSSCNDSCSGPDIYYVGDVGTAIIVDVCSDITQATLVALDVTRPDKTTTRWVGNVYDTTKIRYYADVGDFSLAGEYRVQAYVEMPGWQGHGNTTTFKVTALFE